MAPNHTAPRSRSSDRARFTAAPSGGLKSIWERLTANIYSLIALETKASARLGRWGERTAARHLRRSGYHIIAVNWRTHRGEIDIIARRGSLLVFIEVKTRRAATEEIFRPIDGVTDTQEERLIAAAADYEYANRRRLRRMGLRRIRFDAIAVVSQGLFRRPHITHYPGAYGDR